MEKLSAVFYIVSPHLPQGTIKVQHIFLSTHTLGVKVLDPQRLQTLGSGECNVCLPVLKTSTQTHLNAVQSHPLRGRGGSEGRRSVYMTLVQSRQNCMRYSSKKGPVYVHKWKEPTVAQNQNSCYI